MKDDYQINDIIDQSSELIVYLGQDRAGLEVNITQLKYPEEVIRNLRDGRLFEALRELRKLDHNCLRPTMDGGIDKIDSQPWIVNRLWTGKTLAQKLEEDDFSEEDQALLERHGKALIASLFPKSGALNLKPEKIVFSDSAGGRPIVTFAIEYLIWFKDLAMGYDPGYQRDASAEFQDLLDGLPFGKNPVPRPSATTGPATTTSQPQRTVPLATGNLTPATTGPHLVTTPGASDPLPTSGFNTSPTFGQTVGTRPQPTLASATSKGTKSKYPGLFITLLCLAIAAGIFFVMERNKRAAARAEPIAQKTAPADLSVGKTTPPTPAPVPALPLPVPEPEKPTPIPTPEPEPLVAAPAVPKPEPEPEPTPTPPPSNVFTADDKDTVAGMEGQTVTVRAEVLKVTKSKKGTTFYLYFTERYPQFAAAVSPARADDDLTYDYLQELEGKTITVTGRARREFGKRVLVQLRSRDQIK